MALWWGKTGEGRVSGKGMEGEGSVRQSEVNGGEVNGGIKVEGKER